MKLMKPPRLGKRIFSGYRLPAASILKPARLVPSTRTIAPAMSKKQASAEDQTRLIELCMSALSQSRICGHDDDYFFQVAAALNALLGNLYGKRAADFSNVPEFDRRVLDGMVASTGRVLIGVDARDVTLDMTRGKRGRIVNVDVDKGQDDN